MVEKKLINRICKFIWDPLGFVKFAYPWGEEGTILENEEGPEVWQTDFLNKFTDANLKVAQNIADGEGATSTRIAARSGDGGVGKSALVSWIIHWFMSTRANPQIVVTANTKAQLERNTWRELSKWHNLLINKHWFTWTKSKFYQKQNPYAWYANAVPWNTDRPEAFAGLFADHVLFIMDEASVIDDSIHEVIEGAMTNPGAIWIMVGAPTRNTGKFSEAFRAGSRWITIEVDSRTAKRTNKANIEEWINEYGEDSDFVRVHVCGKEPKDKTEIK